MRGIRGCDTPDRHGSGDIERMRSTETFTIGDKDVSYTLRGGVRRGPMDLLLIRGQEVSRRVPVVEDSRRLFGEREDGLGSHCARS